MCDRQPVFGEGLATLLKSEAEKYSVLVVTTSPSELERSITAYPRRRPARCVVWGGCDD